MSYMCVCTCQHSVNSVREAVAKDNTHLVNLVSTFTCLVCMYVRMYACSIKRFGHVRVRYMYVCIYVCMYMGL